MRNEKWLAHVKIASPGSVMNPVLKKAGYTSRSAVRLMAPVLRKVRYRPTVDPFRPKYESPKDIKSVTRKCLQGNRGQCEHMTRQHWNNVHRKMVRKGLIRVGKVTMDTAALLITDPSYVLHQKKLSSGFGRNYQDFVSRTFTGNRTHGHHLKHNGGHDGLGVVLFSGGDGTAAVYVKPDGYGGLEEARILF